MADRKLLALVRKGTEAWNAWRCTHKYEVVDLSHSNLSDLPLAGVSMAGCFLLGSNFAGTDFRGADLQDSDISKADISGARFDNATLRSTDFSNAFAHSARASWSYNDGDENNVNHTADTEDYSYRPLAVPTSFVNANMTYARLENSSFQSSTFRGAVMHGAFLGGATLVHTDFSEADVKGLELGRTVLSHAQLNNAQNLELVAHAAPSEVDFATLRMAEGGLPTKFLRGLGFSAFEIEFIQLYDQSLTNDEIVTHLYKMADLRSTVPIRLRSVFISYAHADKVFVERLEQSLRMAGFRRWRDVHNFVSGRIEKQLDQAIRMNNIVVLVLSRNSVESDWVEWEVSRAREREKETRRDILCPITLDDAWREANWSGPLFQQVRDYHILDFEGWRSDDVFNAQIEKLIHGLRLHYGAME